MQNEYRISIITVNFNGLEDTCALIDSIPSKEGIEVIVVDNGSAQDEASILSAKYPQIRVIRSEKNLGFAGGNNLGIQAAKGEYLYFINNDTVFKEDSCIEALVRRLKTSENVAIVCPKIRFAWNQCPIQFAGYTPLSSVTLRNRSIGTNESDNGQYDTAHPTPYAHGAAMLVSRKALEKVGTMPECYFLYYEELDWSMMFRRAGFEIWYEPLSTIYHKESQSTGQNSPLKTYYLTRNRLLFARRNLSVPVRCLTYGYLIMIVGLKDIVKEAFQLHTIHCAAIVRGICDFIKKKTGQKG